MIWYFDLSKLDSCTGILVEPGHQVVYTGTQIHTEDERYRNCEAALRLERESDLHLWFGEAPRIELYTVPRTELGGYDSREGYFAGCPDFSLGGEALYYIDRDRNCWLLPGGAEPGWRERMVPARKIRIFGSFEEAAEAYPILRPENDEALMEIFRRMEEA